MKDVIGAGQIVRSRPMNILLVHNFYQESGGEDQVFADEGKLLESRGHKVFRFTMHNDAIRQMSSVAVACKTLWNRQSQVLLRKAIRQSRAQVVHFHNTFPLISPAAYYAAHEEGAAVVQTLHNYRLLCPAALFFRQGQVCEECLGRVPWPGVMHGCYRSNRFASAVVAAMLTSHRLLRTWQREVDVYIVLTEFARRKFIAGGLPPERIIVKPNFVDPDPGIGDGQGDYFLFVGRLSHEKGVETMLQAWEQMPADSTSALKVLGDGPLRAEVEEASRRTPAIQYLGRCPSDRVYAMMGSARALIFPSRCYEGLPRTIVEAMAKGTPVVASRLGSMSELIRHEHNGLLFESGNPQDLLQQVKRVAHGQIDLARMRKAARQEFELRYTAQQNYSKLMACYQQALGNRF